MSSVIKEGYIEKWFDERKCFRPVYAKLCSNGAFQWYEAADSSVPICSIDIKTVSAFLAFGGVLNQVPCRPQAFTESDVDRSFGIPHQNHQDTPVTFFRCTSKAEMGSWLDCVNKLLVDSVGSGQSDVVPQNVPAVETGPYQPYGPPYGSYNQPPPNVAPPPLPGAFGVYPGPSQPTGYPPMQPSMGVPYRGPVPMQPPPVSQPRPLSPYTHPHPEYPGAGPSYGYYPGAQPMMSGQQGMVDSQQVMYDKKGKPYTIIYKNGKPKKKKWKKAALGLAAGAATGWMAGKMLGGLGRTLGYGLGGWGGGWGRPAFGYGGFGRCGSWSSLSSFSSSGGWSS